MRRRWILLGAALACGEPTSDEPGEGTTAGSSSSATSGSGGSTSTTSGASSSGTDASSSGGDATLCNGAAELCDRSYDQVVFPGTHNSVAATKSGFTPLISNQTRPVLAQLEDGIRVLLLDVSAPDGETLLCHTSCALGSRPHIEVLDELRGFLETNPRDVVTIIYQDDVTPAEIEADYDEVGLTALTYAHGGGGWPTLRELIDADTRLVVTAEQGGPPPVWYHHVWDHAWDTPFTFAAPEEFSCDLNRGAAENALFLLNHWMSTEAGLPNESAAAATNTAETLMTRVEACPRLPTFIAVDFYDQGDLFEVVAALNGL